MLRHASSAAIRSNAPRVTTALILEGGSSITSVYRHNDDAAATPAAANAAVVLCQCRSISSSSPSQSSLCTHISSHIKKKQQQRQLRVVNPSIKQRRPHVNGEAVAFHIRDLQQTQQHQQTPPPFPFPYASSNNGSARNDDQYDPFQQLKQKEYESDLIVVLDMDECLIHSQFLSNPSMAHVFAHQLQNHRRNSGTAAGASSLLNKTKKIDHFRFDLSAGAALVHVNMRPGLMEFLNDVTSRYETHIFTAAKRVYADQVLDRLDPTRTKFAARWYREHCSFDPNHKAYVKDLSALPPLQQQDDDDRLARTVLVDNNPLSFLSHPSNGILVSSFFDDPFDTGLKKVKRMLEELEDHNDVRPILEHRFGLKEALDKLETTTKLETTAMPSTASML